MTLSIDGHLSGTASWPHKGGHGDHAVAMKAATRPAAARPASSATELQGFATDLQSLLVNLQASTANANRVATDPAASGSGPTASGPLANMAERLQHLLQGQAGPGVTEAAGAGSTASHPGTANSATDAGSADPSQSALAKLQASLSQALQTYATTASRATTRLSS